MNKKCKCDKFFLQYGFHSDQNCKTINLQERDKIITILEKYSEWLQQQGYLDSDWNMEWPYAIDEFLKTLNN